MAQPTNYQVDGDDNGPTYNSKLQALIDAFTTDFSGPSAPATTQPNMLWIDTSTSPPTHWRRNTTDTAWDKVGQFSNNIYYGSVTGSSGSTSKLATARSISVSGDATGSASFDGSANANISMTLANSGVTAGSYGGTNVFPRITVDAKGRITSVSTSSVTYPITSFNGRTGAVTLQTSDVSGVLPSASGNSGKVLALNASASGMEWVPTVKYISVTTTITNPNAPYDGAQIYGSTLYDVLFSISGDTLVIEKQRQYTWG